MKTPFSFSFSLAFLIAAAPLANADSLWRSGAHSMFADRRARAVGDIVTILVQETNAATKEKSTSTSKTSEIDASLSSFLYGPAASGLLTKGGKYPALKLGARSDFDGGGRIDNSERVTARIAVQVIDTLPNGQLVIEGRREIAFSGERQDAILRGIVRPEDITASNTVFSYNVASASIQFISKGTLTDAHRKGWFHRAWDKVSPF